MTYISNLTRPAGDPKVMRTGPSSMDVSDRLGRGLGWFSIVLGAVEMLAPARLARALGLRGRENLLYAYGLRELSAGVLSLSVDRQAGLYARVAGDMLDIATLLPALRPGNRQHENAKLALALVAGVTLLDLLATRTVSARHHRGEAPRRFPDRSGFPRGVQNARGAAAPKPA